MAVLFRPFGFSAPTDFKIIWLSNILALGVPDEGYSRNVPCALNLIFTFINWTHWTQKNLGIWRWQSRSWLGKGAKIWQDYQSIVIFSYCILVSKSAASNSFVVLFTSYMEMVYDILGFKSACITLKMMYILTITKRYCSEIQVMFALLRHCHLHYHCTVTLVAELIFTKLLFFFVLV